MKIPNAEALGIFLVVVMVMVTTVVAGFHMAMVFGAGFPGRFQFQCHMADAVLL